MTETNLSNFSYPDLLQHRFPTFLVESGNHGRYGQDNPAPPDDEADTEPAQGILRAPLRTRELFGANLRKLRRFLNLSQQELGVRAGMNRHYLSEVERGLHNIGFDEMHALAQAMSVELRDLLDSKLLAVALKRVGN